jgi:hypothetical protein
MIINDDWTPVSESPHNENTGVEAAQSSAVKEARRLK